MSQGGRSNIIFSATLYGDHSSMWELVVSEDKTVHYTHRPPGDNQYRTEELDLPWRHVSDLLWKLEDIVFGKWDHSIDGQGQVGQPGSWMVLLERDRTMHKWQGNGHEIPPEWKRFRAQIEEVIDRPFGLQ